MIKNMRLRPFMQTSGGSSGIKRSSKSSKHEEDITFSNEKIIYPYDKNEILKELEKSPAGTTVSLYEHDNYYITYTVEEKDGQKVVKDSWDRDVPIAQGLRSGLDDSEIATIRYYDNKGKLTEVKDFQSFKARPGAERVRITMRREEQIWDEDNPKTANRIVEVNNDIFVYKKIPAGFERTDVVYIDSKTNNKYRRFRGPAEPGKSRMLNVYKRER